MDVKINEIITLSMVVGYCHSAFNDIAEQLSKGDTNKASSKVYEAVKYIRSMTIMYHSADALQKEALTDDETTLF